jgi:uncharacterized membrane protein YjgN (DUF898 family)
MQLSGIFAHNMDMNSSTLEPLIQNNPIPLQPSVESHSLRFTGSAGEYFRIWIVNMALTIVTLGIYNAWAKVRTRRYFYAHTMLNDHPFEYHGDPKAILKGNVIVAGGFILYYLSQNFFPLIAPVLAVAFSLVLPYLIYSSLHFRAINSSYRNIHFRFHGTRGESYGAYLWWQLLVPITLGIMFPYVMFKQKQYFFDNFAFGTSKATFSGEKGKFYKVYLTAGLIIGLLGIPFFIIMGKLIQYNINRQSDPTFMAMFVPAYALLLLGITLIQQFIYGNIMNYCWSKTSIPGKVRFKSTLKVKDLMLLRFTNMLAVIFTAGLLTPWARVRHAKYVLDHLKVLSKGNFEDFTADEGQKVGPLGDAATDFLDVDMGL